MVDFSSGFMAPKQAYEPNSKVINGSIKLGIQEAYASYTWPIAAGANVVVTADAAGTAGNALDFQATADGLAPAELDLGAAGLTQLDTVIEFATGGTGGNDWVVTIAAGSGGGEGVNVNEDTTNKVLTVMFEDGVSTVANFETAIGTTTNFTVGTGGTGASVLAAGQDEIYEEPMAGGTAQEWAEESGSPLKMHLHYTDAATTGTEAKTAINAVTGKSMTATGGDGNACASGDAVAKQDLSGGLDDTAPGATQTGLGYSVTQTVEGTYTITFDRVLGELLHFKPILSLATAADLQCLTGAYSAADRTIVVWTVNNTGAADDPASVAAGDAIHFKAVFRTTGA
jgi:hypothetical protein